MSPPKPSIEHRLAARLAPAFDALPEGPRATRRKLLIVLGGLLSLSAGLACALALALFLMGMAQGRTTDQAAAVWVTGAVCVGFGFTSWSGWLINRVGRLLG
ncbi:MAG: hypothetical protein ABIO70_34910 [Pseudomonadota bacterium]